MGAVQRSVQRPDVVEITVPSDGRFLELIDACTEQICHRAAHLPADEIYKIAWAVHEACMNVIEHAHQFQASKPLRIEAVLSPWSLEFNVYDCGPGFDLGRVGDPDGERGRGILGIRQCMHVVEYLHGLHCNCMRLVRLIEEA